MIYTYIFDIDGTISDSRWRSEHAEARDWDTFHGLCEQDAPLPAARLMRSLVAADHCIILLTGRNEKFRKQTQAWLKAHDLQVDELLMRPDNNFDAAEIVKEAQLVEYFGDIDKAKVEVTCMFEDSEKVAEHFRQKGFTVFTTLGGIG